MATFKMENCYQLLSKWHYSSVTTLFHLPLHNYHDHNDALANC